MTNSDDADTSKLHVLADVAALFYDELQRAKKGKSKIVSHEEEEDTVKSFFDSVPRKARSCSVKRSDYEVENLSGASTSSSPSSLLLDLNPSSLTLKKMNIPLRFRPCSSHSRLHYSTVESRRPEATSSRWFADYDMEVEDPQSSLASCVTERKSRKRSALKEKKRPGGSKKAKVAHLSWKGREIPQSLLNMMRGMNVLEEPKLIFERTLYATDVNPHESRLSMPISQVISNDFLTSHEMTLLEDDISNANKLGFGAILVDQRGEKWGVFLKRWETKGSWLYTVTCGWNEAVAANGMKEGDGISVWTFRVRGLLCFALVPPPQKGHTSSSSSLTQ